ncbi:MAG: hypothetical protein GKR93_12105 [Gammaproteobacteria bacterium]|nr:hypothetical protein [Gammaproteobacteria bacterium]
MTRKIIIALFILLTTTNVIARTYGPYDANVVSVIDGDTVIIDVMVWPQQLVRTALRIKGVDTPEKRTKSACEKELGLAAMQFTKEFLAVAYQNVESVMVYDIEIGSFAGRVVGGLMANGVDLGTLLLSNGHAREYRRNNHDLWCEDV